MKPTQKIELLAPAGTWDALTAAVEAGADAVYLGGKLFNMRLHRNEYNFSNEDLQKALDYTHQHGVKLYITLNNLIDTAELDALKEYLLFLDRLQPDALLVQDFAVLQLIKELKLHITVHSSIMMNIHSEAAVEKLKEYGVTRIVASTQLKLNELTLLKERTGIEIEYFVHGDICISANSQCYHSGVVFGLSGNRGRCLKPCRWPYKLIKEDTGEIITSDKGAYKLAMKDICMYRNIPELIEAGIDSCKIEGRMRPPEFISRIVRTYRQAIDAYYADPAAYTIDETAWQNLYENRARNFTTAFALGENDSSMIGYDGTREPRFFSKAKEEPALQSELLAAAMPIMAQQQQTQLAVRVSSVDSAMAAIDNGADAIYVSGDAFLPQKPLTRKELLSIKTAAAGKAKFAVMLPRMVMPKENKALKEHLIFLNDLQPDAVIVSTIGELALVRELTRLPVQTDFSFNLFNPAAAKFLQENGVSLATTSLELSFDQLANLRQQASLPLEVIVQGPYESKICHFPLPVWEQNLDLLATADTEVFSHAYALLNEAGGKESIRLDQNMRTHIFFAKELCLLPYLHKFSGIASLRIEAQLYSPEQTAAITALYKKALGKKLTAAETAASLDKLQKLTTRPLGTGALSFQTSL